MLASDKAANILAAVPVCWAIPRPTVAIIAIPGCTTIESGLQEAFIPSITAFCLFFNSASEITKQTVSIPEGIFSKDIPFCSRIDKSFLQKPSSEFIEIEITVKSFLPAIPVTIFGLLDKSQSFTIKVPLSCGLFVFFIFIGIPAFLTGNIESSCKTEAPIYDSSLSSEYVIVLIGFGLSIILGSAIRKPETSVQFSYKSAFMLSATNAPVTSDPPLEKVTILPSLSAP